MAEERIQKTKTSSKTEEVVEKAPAKTDSKEKLKADVDEFLDEIDTLLEEIGVDTVLNFRQKGGE